MDRRRYIPRVDGLETRVVLSTTSAAAAAQTAIVHANASAAAAATSAEPATVTPATAYVAAQTRTTATTPRAATATKATTNPPAAAWQQTRIDRLPLLLQQTSRTRIVPPALVQSLQYNLVLMTNNLHRPKASGLQAFNDQLRATISSPTIRQENAAQLNALFGKILADAGCVPWLVQKFQIDMNELAKIDSFQSNSANLVANDYGLILQIALGVGVVRPGAKPS